MTLHKILKRQMKSLARLSTREDLGADARYELMNAINANNQAHLRVCGSKCVENHTPMNVLTTIGSAWVVT